MLVSLLLLCAALLGVAAFAHYRLAALPANTRWFTGLTLLGIGLAFAWTMAFVYTDTTGIIRTLVFISAAALVHVPAAVILQFKYWRGRIP